MNDDLMAEEVSAPSSDSFISVKLAVPIVIKNCETLFSESKSSGPSQRD